MPQMNPTQVECYTASIIIIGNEILSGRTQEANLRYLAQGLNAQGIRLSEVRVIADLIEPIVAGVNELRARYDYVFTTGGIGPTHDDVTSQAIAQSFGINLERNAEAVRRLKAYYGDALNEPRLRMAQLPVNATLLDNPVSQAPGYQVENVYVLPGVPRILQAMFDGFKQRLAGGQPMLSRAVNAFIPESTAAAGLAEIQKKFPDAEIGSYPFIRNRQLGTALVVRSPVPAELEAAIQEIAELVRSLGATPELTDGESASTETDP